MKRLMAVAATGAGLMVGSAQADGFDEGFELGVRAVKAAQDVCLLELEYTLRGYDLKEMEEDFEKEFKISDIPEPIVEAYRKGFQINSMYEFPLKESFAHCVDARIKRIIDKP